MRKRTELCPNSISFQLYSITLKYTPICPYSSGQRIRLKIPSKSNMQGSRILEQTCNETSNGKNPRILEQTKLQILGKIQTCNPKMQRVKIGKTNCTTKAHMQHQCHTKKKSEANPKAKPKQKNYKLTNSQEQSTARQKL